MILQSLVILYQKNFEGFYMKKLIFHFLRLITWINILKSRSIKYLTLFKK